MCLMIWTNPRAAAVKLATSRVNALTHLRRATTVEVDPLVARIPAQLVPRPAEKARSATCAEGITCNVIAPRRKTVQEGRPHEPRVRNRTALLAAHRRSSATTVDSLDTLAKNAPALKMDQCATTANSLDTSRASARMWRPARPKFRGELIPCKTSLIRLISISMFDRRCSSVFCWV